MYENNRNWSHNSLEKPVIFEVFTKLFFGLSKASSFENRFSHLFKDAKK